MVLSELQIYHLERVNNPRRKMGLSFHYLGKLGAVTHRDLQACRALLDHLLDTSLHQHPLEAPPVIIGLAESAILLSALMHHNTLARGITAQWICSTRRAAPGLQFVEQHSHGPHHVLPLPETQQPTELWIVEDEITTGRTVLQIALLLQQRLPVRQVRFFTLADIRHASHRIAFERSLAAADVRHSLHAAVQFESQPEADGYVDRGQKRSKSPAIHQKGADGWLMPRLRPALCAQPASTLSTDGSLRGRLLVIGEAMDLGARLLLQNPQLSLQHVTISPWRVDYKSIFSCLALHETFYLYNFTPTPEPIYILCDPLDAAIGESLRDHLSAQGHTVTMLAGELWMA